MKVTFLGTGTSQGIPVVACECPVCRSTDSKDKRLRTSVLVEVDDVTFVIDSGPDFRQQLLNEKVKKLDAILFTHEHKDHIAGLDDVRPFNYMHDKEIDVYASLRVQEALKREFLYIFDELYQYPGVPRINLITIGNQPFNINGVQINPIEVMHYKLPVYGFRIKDFTYITDANYIDEAEKKKIFGSKVVVLNALRKEKHISHFTLDEAVELLTELDPEEGFLVHMSHQMGKHEELNKTLPKKIRLAYDGFVLNF